MSELKIKRHSTEKQKLVLRARNEHMLNSDWSSKDFFWFLYMILLKSVYFSYMVFLGKKNQ